jgi:DNA-binding MarR family transcriptional regulator
MQKPAVVELQLNQFLPYRMVNLAANMSLALSKIYKKEFDLNIAQWRVLAQLGEQQALYAKDIGEITAMDKSKVSRAVKSLQEKGYINRQTDKNDNRAAYLSLTQQGKALYKKIVPKALDWENQLLAVLDKHEGEALLQVLNKLDQQVTLLE